MAQTVNQQLQDAAVSHAVDLQHYSTEVVRRIMALLNRTDADLAAALSQALERLPASEFSVDRLELLLQSVRSLNSQAYVTVGQELTSEMRKLAEYEAGYQLQLFQTVLPPQVVASVGVAGVNVEQVYAAAMARPFQGVLLREALTGLEQSRAKLIRDQVRMGYIQQETVQQIVTRLRGTRAKAYQDGLWERPRRDLEAVVRTAISHTAGVARDRFHESNSDLLKGFQWLSTLDLRTSVEWCVPRDHLKYTLDHKPIGHNFKWLAGPGRLHWNCRSTSTPIVKSWRELGFSGDEFTPSERASMDGAVAAETTYPDWLKKQSTARQDQVLGPERGKLFRQGGLGLREMFDRRGQFMTLEQLKAQDAKAFHKVAA